MKFFFDQNFSKRLTKALNELTPRSTKCIHVTQRWRSTTDDLVWLRSLGKEGGWVIVTYDKRLRLNPAERDAIKEFGLMVICLARQWQKIPFWEQNWQFIRAFPVIMKLCGDYRPSSWHEIKIKPGKKQIEPKTI